MSNELKICDCKVLKDYKLQITFADGLKGVVTVKYLVGKGVFKLWEDYEQFKKVEIDPISKTVSWQGRVD